MVLFSGTRVHKDIVEAWVGSVSILLNNNRLWRSEDLFFLISKGRADFYLLFDRGNILQKVRWSCG